MPPARPLGTVEGTGLGELVDAGLSATAAAFSVEPGLFQVLQHFRLVRDQFECYPRALLG